MACRDLDGRGRQSWLWKVDDGTTGAPPALSGVLLANRNRLSASWATELYQARNLSLDPGFISADKSVLSAEVGKLSGS